MRRGGNQRGGMSHPENPAGGVFPLLTLWCPLCRADTIWPAGMQPSRGLEELEGLLSCRGMGFG